MDAGHETDTHESGATLTRGGRHFGRWWVAEVETITSSGIDREHLFYGYQGVDLVQLHGLEASRAFAAQLLEAIDYAETDLAGDR